MIDRRCTMIHNRKRSKVDVIFIYFYWWFVISDFFRVRIFGMVGAVTSIVLFTQQFIGCFRKIISIDLVDIFTLIREGIKIKWETRKRKENEMDRLVWIEVLNQRVWCSIRFIKSVTCASHHRTNLDRWVCMLEEKLTRHLSHSTQVADQPKNGCIDSEIYHERKEKNKQLQWNLIGRAVLTNAIER